jgi:hypothetical protein
MSRSNLLWGAPRIHGELLKLGLKVASGPEAGLVCNWEKLVEANEMRLASMAIRSGRDGFREQYGAQAWEDFITSNGLFINAFLN